MPKFIHTNSSGKRKNTLLTDIQKAIEKPSQSSSKKELLNKKVKKEKLVLPPLEGNVKMDVKPLPHCKDTNLNQNKVLTPSKNQTKQPSCEQQIPEIFSQNMFKQQFRFKSTTSEKQGYLLKKSKDSFEEFNHQTYMFIRHLLETSTELAEYCGRKRITVEDLQRSRKMLST